MGNKLEKIVKLKAKEFDKKRAFLLPADITCKFLTKDAETGEYTEIFDVQHWFHEYQNYREQTLVRVATLAQDFEDALLIASDMAIRGDVYELNKRDVAPPDGNRGWWQIFVSKTEFRYP